MTNWFTVKLKYTKQLDNGTLKRVTEPYLVGALTFTDAEARIYEELGNAIRGEFLVAGIARTEIHNIYPLDGSSVWYKCKAVYETSDGEGGGPKKINQYYLCEGSTVQEAYDNLKTNLSDLMEDFKILSVTESPIIEIFPLEKGIKVPSEESSQESAMVPNTDFEGDITDEYDK